MQGKGVQDVGTLADSESDLWCLSVLCSWLSSRGVLQPQHVIVWVVPTGHVPRRRGYDGVHTLPSGYHYPTLRGQGIPGLRCWIDPPEVTCALSLKTRPPWTWESGPFSQPWTWAISPGVGQCQSGVLFQAAEGPTVRISCSDSRWTGFASVRHECVAVQNGFVPSKETVTCDTVEHNTASTPWQRIYLQTDLVDLVQGGPMPQNAKTKL